VVKNLTQRRPTFELIPNQLPVNLDEASSEGKYKVQDQREEERRGKKSEDLEGGGSIYSDDFVVTCRRRVFYRYILKSFQSIRVSLYLSLISYKPVSILILDKA
jgi:hypothetical protein